MSAVLAVGGCGEREPSESDPGRSPQGSSERPPRLEPVRCPPPSASCATATGRIVYVEAVDPDGDGDAHFVLLSDESITGPGISVIDVAPDLRPEPLPEPGDLLSAAGPVHRGSFGQRQIEAIEVRATTRTGPP